MDDILEVQAPKPVPLVRPFVSIIIPTYNKLHLLMSCLDSVLQYTDLSKCEIIVVSNGCHDGTTEYLCSHPIHRRIEHLTLPGAVGFPAAVNEGIKRAKGQYVVLLNNDTVLLKQSKNKWIEQLLAPFEKMIEPGGKKVGVTGPAKFHWTCGNTKRRAIAFWCAMIPKALFSEIGLIDEAFSPGMGEDGDFCIKAEMAGYSLVAVPIDQSEEFGKGIPHQEFPIYHAGSGTFGEKDYSEVKKRNDAILLERYGQKKVSIVIPTCGKDWENVLKVCVQRVWAHTNWDNKELIIVPNGAPKEALEYLRQLKSGAIGTDGYGGVSGFSPPRPDMKIIEFPDRIGYIRAVNAGIQDAGGEFVILLDDDSLLQPYGKDYWFDMLMAPFLKDEKVGAAGPFSTTYEDLGQTLHSGCTMYLRKALLEVGLFDEAFNPGYMGDEDLSIRIRKAGYKLVEVPEGQKRKYVDGTFHIDFPVVHTGDVATMPKHTTDLPLVKKNRDLLLARHGMHSSHGIHALNVANPLPVFEPEVGTSSAGSGPWKPTVSIIIPTAFARLEDLLKPNLQSIIEYTDLTNVEVVVVANGCTDGVEEYVKSLGPNFKVISFPDAIGYTRATNEGIKVATGEFLIFYNNDNQLLPQDKNDWLDKLLAPFKDNPKMGITGPLQLHDDYADQDVIIGFCLCIRKSVLQDVMADVNGLLDEIYSPGSGEDIDLCCKARAKGYIVRQVPKEGKLGFGHTNEGEFQIWHKDNQTFRHMEEYTRYIVKRNGWINCKKFNKNIKLNLGSGGIEYPGYLSVDLHDRRATIIQDITKLDFEENTVAEMMASHVLEHLSPYVVLDTLKLWFKLLKPGGKLVMEMPDIESLCKRFIVADTGKRYGLLNCIYGAVNTTSEGEPSDITSPHLWGWWPQAIADHLYNAGFVNVTFGPEIWPHPEPPNMHVSAEKPNV